MQAIVMATPTATVSQEVPQEVPQPPATESWKTNAIALEQQWALFNAKFDQLGSALARSLARMIGAPVDASQPALSSEEKAKVFRGEKPSLGALCDRIRTGEVKKVVVCCGAGISTAAGIPDFRSPDTGLYAKLQREREVRIANGDSAAAELPENMQECFSAAYFAKDPVPMIQRLAPMWPTVNSAGEVVSRFKPTAAHRLMKTLQDMGALAAVFTQNIDGLELAAGISPSVVYFCHGNLNSVICHGCRRVCTPSELTTVMPLLHKGVPVPCAHCSAAAKSTPHFLRPGIVMFGESMPHDFEERTAAALQDCDTIIVMGTSLQVQPFASIPGRAPRRAPRVLLNKEVVGPFADDPQAYRDVVILGDLESSCVDMQKRIQPVAGAGVAAVRAARRTLTTTAPCRRTPSQPRRPTATTIPTGLPKGRTLGATLTKLPSVIKKAPVEQRR